jgi:putative ABC transport system ATP-binding protein
MQAVISVKNIFKIYKMGSQTLAALNDVSMDVFPGEYIAIMGSSGSGKSTFMNILGCLDVPTRGEYLFNGESVTSKSKIQLAHLRRDNIGFVFQSFNLLSRTTAYDNVELPLLYCNIPASERKIKVEKALTSVGLKDRMNNMPNMLSGGQQQRVAIARAIVNNPKMILADEPTGNLDTRTSMEIIQIFQLLNDEGITIVMVTHEDDIARSSKRRVVFKDGKMIKSDDTTDRLIASEQLKLLPVLEEVLI